MVEIQLLYMCQYETIFLLDILPQMEHSSVIYKVQVLRVDYPKVIGIHSIEKKMLS
jgi:hypothetical protein